MDLLFVHWAKILNSYCVHLPRCWGYRDDYFLVPASEELLLGREETHTWVYNEDARGEAASLCWEQQAVGNGRKGDPNKVAWLCPATPSYEA